MSLIQQPLPILLLHISYQNNSAESEASSKRKLQFIVSKNNQLQTDSL